MNSRTSKKGFGFLVLSPQTSAPSGTHTDLVFWFLVCYVTTQLATQLPQRRIQVVRSIKVVRKRLTDFLFYFWF